ncbi:Zn-ribbon domain-containing OB-fold protein [Nocardioides hungaricus]
MSRPYWDACREGRLLVQQCDACRRCFFRPEEACTHCASEAWSWTESTGSGTLYSFTTIYRAPDPAIAVPYVLAVVAMAEGYPMFSNVVDCVVDDVHIGMSLAVSFHPVGDGAVPVFRPVIEP